MINLDELIEGVKDLYPGTDRQALRCMGELLLKDAERVREEWVKSVRICQERIKELEAKTARLTAQIEDRRVMLIGVNIADAKGTNSERADA